MWFANCLLILKPYTGTKHVHMKKAFVARFRMKFEMKLNISLSKISIYILDFHSKIFQLPPPPLFFSLIKGNILKSSCSLLYPIFSLHKILNLLNVESEKLRMECQYNNPFYK